MRTGDRAEPGLPGHAGEASSPIPRVPPAALLRRRRREYPRVADAELAAGLRLLELPAAHHLHHAQRQLAVAHAFRRGPDDASARSDVESRHELSLQRLPFLQPLLVAVADLAGVAADVVADQPTLLARGRRVSFDGQGLTRVRAVGPLRLEAEPDAALLRHVSILKLAVEEAEALAGGIEPRALGALGPPEVLVTFGRVDNSVRTFDINVAGLVDRIYHDRGRTCLPASSKATIGVH